MGHERTDDDAPADRPHQTRQTPRTPQTRRTLETLQARLARGACLDCDWYRVQINRAAGDPRPRADLEALYGAHLRRRHGDEARGPRSV
ncbi:hypothetical protein GCM10009863_30960 [Streptomyces axinellae]|uniref:Uncharacterized protein n=1 Tax=Streptomyces axinellae TaxID=552788 RepID=A0ABN3Q3F9_9ACTN